MIGQTNAKINIGGGEQPQLFDTKILNSASAPEGWAYTCSNTYRTFSSSTLPTLYNDINTKLQNSNSVYSDQYIINYNYSNELTDINFTSFPIEAGFVLCNNKYYGSYEYYPGERHLFMYDNNSWNMVLNDYYIETLFANKIGTSIVAIESDGHIYKINPTNNNIIKIANSSIFQGGDSGTYTRLEVFHKEFNNNFYFYDGGLINGTHVYSTPIDPTVNSINDYTFNKTIADITYKDNYWYLLTREYYNNNDFLRIYKGQSLANSDLSDTSKWQMIYSQFGYGRYICTINDKFVVFYNNSNYIYTNNEFNSVNTMTISNFNIQYMAKIDKTNDVIILLATDGTFAYCNLLDITDNNNWTVIRLNNCTVHENGCSNFINNKLYIINQSNNKHGSSLSVVSDFDSVTINYSKYQNFKICQYSDLTNLNTLYNKYDMSEYWNIYNNMISIPVNKQQYKVMYVGDNFVDNLYE